MCAGLPTGSQGSELPRKIGRTHLGNASRNLHRSPKIMFFVTYRRSHGSATWDAAFDVAVLLGTRDIGGLRTGSAEFFRLSKTIVSRDAQGLSDILRQSCKRQGMPHLRRRGRSLRDSLCDTTTSLHFHKSQMSETSRALDPFLFCTICDTQCR